MFLHVGTIFLSAFLLFLVQPIIAKQILPWFGGAASVWAICLVFFQSLLLVGYAYADWTTRFLPARRQAWLHVALLAASLALLPIFPDARWKPAGDQDPTLAILGLLTATIGLPYLLLSTTSPLVQAWFWQKFRHAVPYRLFALSNFASLLALLSYPVTIEPWISSVAQSRLWSWAYALFALLCALTALSSASAARAPAAAEAGAADAKRPTPGDRLMWMMFSAMGSCLLLATTNHLTQNIASVPFLWVVPLSLYLITFILCFDHPRWYLRKLIMPAAAAFIAAMSWQIDTVDVWLALPLYTAGLFVCCMFCHGELTRIKPAARHLTAFYLMISVGGALGALLVGIVAPNVLSGYYELGICLVACAVLLAARAAPLARWMPLAAAAMVAGVALAVGMAYERYVSQTRMMTRNFYGVVRTRDFADPVPFRALYHGAINHGGQLLNLAERNRPSSYFGRSSGYGRLFASLPAAPRAIAARASIRATSARETCCRNRRSRCGTPAAAGPVSRHRGSARRPATARCGSR